MLVLLPQGLYGLCFYTLLGLLPTSILVTLFPLFVLRMSSLLSDHAGLPLTFRSVGGCLSFRRACAYLIPFAGFAGTSLKLDLEHVKSRSGAVPPQSMLF